MSRWSALPRTWLALDAALALALGWLYGGDLADALAAPGAAVAAMSALPSPVLPALALGLMLAALGPVVFGVLQGRGGDFKGYRVLPMVALVVFFVDFFAVFGSQPPLGSAERTALVLQRLAEQATDAATAEAVPDLKTVVRLAEALGPPPYLVKGQPLSRWAVVGKTGCLGPETAAADLSAGTVIYCVASDRHTAWLSAVGLLVGRRFGEPAVVGRGAEVISTTITSAPPAEDEVEVPEPLSAQGGGAP